MGFKKEEATLVNEAAAAEGDNTGRPPPAGNVKVKGGGGERGIHAFVEEEAGGRGGEAVRPSVRASQMSRSRTGRDSPSLNFQTLLFFVLKKCLREIS